MPAAVMTCDATTRRSQAIQRGAELLRRGGLVVFPTETVYGVGAAVTADRGIERLRELKQQTGKRPFTVHLPDVDHVDQYVDVDAQPALQRLVRKTMPGPITVVAEVSDRVIQSRLAALGIDETRADRLYHDNTIGLRCPDDRVAMELLGAVETPVVASSANHPGGKPPHNATAAGNALGEDVDLIIDGGQSRYARPSSVVKVRADGTVDVLREGVYDKRYIRKLMRRSILFVCSGNTCRSPMAEAIARHELARRLNIRSDQLSNTNWQVLSVGVYAGHGSPATPEALDALQSLGIEPHDHESRGLSREHVQQAEAVYCMTEAHREAVLSMVPDAADRVHLLDPDGDIDDPIGGGPEVYKPIAERMQKLVRQRLKELGA